MSLLEPRGGVRALIVAALLFASFGFAAQAQWCTNYGSHTDTTTPGTATSSSSGSCDQTYFNTVVRCCAPGATCDDPVGTMPACPKDPMPMKDTPMESFVGHQPGQSDTFSPYLYIAARSMKDASKFYTSDFYRGTPGDTATTFQMVGGAGATQQFDTCVSQIKMLLPTELPTDQAKEMRLELDNCVNQYLLQNAPGIFQGQNPLLLSGEVPEHPDARISLHTSCQPLHTVYDPNQEYLPSDYIQAAWTKLLVDANSRKTPPDNMKGWPAAALEPHLPCGPLGNEPVKGGCLDPLTIKNPIPAPSPFPQVRINAIAAHTVFPEQQFEEILDPSHPFSPRWDFRFNERDHYSPMTSGYSDDTKNSVFCAGDKDENINKVDILTFREARLNFDKNVTDRIKYNTACHNNSGDQHNPCCLTVVVDPKDTNTWICVPQSCETCFAATAQSPACATDYVTIPDRKFTIPPFLPVAPSMRGDDPLRFMEVLKHPYLPTATCNPDEKTGLPNTSTMADMCMILRRPVTPINRLKMRYYNPDDSANNSLTAGVQEGLNAKEYFGDHMPYMRLWDTGQSIQRIPAPEQDPMDTTGQYTAIVGVGREAMPGGQGGGGSHTDQRCLYGGWGGGAGSSVSFGGATIHIPDPVTSWTELKLYQARTQREEHVACLGRYEKVFKPGNTENFALTGDILSSTIISKCANGQGCDQQVGGSTANPNTTGAITSIKQDAIPLIWRGYLSAKDSSNRFPNFGSGSSGFAGLGGASMLTGLDNADCDDVVVMPNGSTTLGTVGLPTLGLVTQVNLPGRQSCHSTQASDCIALHNCSVTVVESDTGKWPDVCGNTDFFGQAKERVFFRVGMLSQKARDEYTNNVQDVNGRAGWISTCDDSKLSQCELPSWDTTKVYRIRSDQRKGSGL